jgi:glycosyltransferase involved in cell wall biosynthesis
MSTVKPLVTVVIPAHNEERYIGRCIASVRRAQQVYGGDVEILVVCNRCTDRTAETAWKYGAKVLYNEDRCIAAVRNAGIAAAKGKILLTIDADNRMTPGTIREVWLLLGSGQYIGGGAPMLFERESFPLFLNDLMCRAGFALTGLYCGIFWAKTETFREIGGFADLRAMEDAATAKRLKALGKQTGKAYTCLRENCLINSTRKFDEQGDWLYLRMMLQNTGSFVKAALGDTGELDKIIDDLFYDYPR